ncbi:MAG: hypothetical protein F6K55_29120 [Moorea sp. SIO4A3]|nr:hypothetical protein [Moorena sp. SIO4A3]
MEMGRGVGVERVWMDVGVVQSPWRKGSRKRVWKAFHGLCDRHSCGKNLSSSVARWSDSGVSKQESRPVGADGGQEACRIPSNVFGRLCYL